MEIWYDWRLSRVVDAEGNVLDQVNWSASSSVNALVERLSDLQSGRLSPEARVLANRFPEAVSNPLGAISDESWPELSKEESEMLSEASIALARKGVAASASDPDRRLDMLSSSSIELRASWTTQEARSVEWAGLFLPDLDLDERRSDIPLYVSKSKDFENKVNPESVVWQNVETDYWKNFLKNLVLEHSNETGSLISRDLISNFENEINNFIQVCPKEMLDKLDNPITLKTKVKEVS